MHLPVNSFILFAACTLFITACDRETEETSLTDPVPVSEAPFPIVADTIDLVTYPLQFDPDHGVATARLGEGRIFQVELTLVEIPPGGRLPPDRHLAEEFVYIVTGEGYTSMWMHADEKPMRYDWTAGDLLSPSLNSWHQHVNTSSQTPARYLSVTTTPLSRNLFHNDEFLASSGFIFEERWNKGINQQARYKGPDTMDMQSGHYIADLPGRELQEVGGRWGLNLRPDNGDMAGNRLLEIFVREYRNKTMSVPSTGDRHPWEKIYLALEGEGSAILKPAEGPARVVNWKKGEIFLVEGHEHHDIGPRIGAELKPPYARIMQLKAPGYFDNVGNVGGNQRTYVTGDDVLITE